MDFVNVPTVTFCEGKANVGAGAKAIFMFGVNYKHGHVSLIR